jgi:hypothetical protein
MPRVGFKTSIRAGTDSPRLKLHSHFDRPGYTMKYSIAGWICNAVSLVASNIFASFIKWLWTYRGTAVEEYSYKNSVPTSNKQASALLKPWFEGNDSSKGKLTLQLACQLLNIIKESSCNFKMASYYSKNNG